MRQIFIGGCHRSGNHLLGAMLGSGNALLCVPEAPFKIDCLYGSGIPTTSEGIHAIFLQIQKHWRFSAWQLTPADFANPPKWPTYGNLINWIVEVYNKKFYNKKFNIWIDNTPKNIQYVYTLRQIFPDAKFIHIVRDGRAVAASVLPLDWGPNTIISAAHWWVHNVSYGLAAEADLGEECMLRVKYESLVTRPETEIRRICTWLGIAYDESMVLDRLRKEKHQYKYHALINQAPQSDRASAWVNKLSSRQIETFECQTKEFLMYLGYKPQFDGLCTATYKRELLKTFIMEPLKVVWNFFLFRIWWNITFRNRHKLT